MERKKPGRKAEPASRRGVSWPGWTGFRGKTAWDWLHLLIVPLALALIGLAFSIQQDARQQQIENQRAASDRRIEEQRAQDEALQAYLDQIGTLLLEKNLRASDKGSEVRTLARARTLTVLGRLDPKRKAAVMDFLVEADLVLNVKHTSHPDEYAVPIISLADADLSGANLQGIDLWNASMTGADLSGASLAEARLLSADLSYADLTGADLSDAFLADADVSYADLSEAELDSATLGRAELRLADLSGADLSGADLYSADLFDADLAGADLSDALVGGAILSDADLSGADLSGANLSYAALVDATGITNDELEQQAKSLEGATMPNGQKYEDWLKSKGSGEDGQDSGPS